MAAGETETLIKAVRVCPPFVGGELDKVAAARPALIDRPFDHLPADAARAPVAGDPNRLDLPAPGAFAERPARKVIRGVLAAGAKRIIGQHRDDIRQVGGLRTAEGDHGVGHIARRRGGKIEYAPRRALAPPTLQEERQRCARALSSMFIDGPARQGLVLGFSGFSSEHLLAATVRLGKLFRQRQLRWAINAAARTT